MSCVGVLVLMNACKDKPGTPPEHTQKSPSEAASGEPVPAPGPSEAPAETRPAQSPGIGAQEDPAAEEAD